MEVIRGADARHTETPNAVMTTYASPSQGGSARSLWRVEMAPGAQGPVHAMDSEQTWTVLRGSATVTVAGERLDLASGDTVVIPCALERQIAADPRDGLAAIVSGSGDSRASSPGHETAVPPWIA